MSDGYQHGGAFHDGFGCERCNPPEPEPILYFAFGMNLAPEYMEGAKKVGRARLYGWRLVFRGFADIEPAPPYDWVEGGVWEVDDEMLRQLDRREGAFGGPYDMYERITVKAQLPWDEVEAITYRMLPRAIHHTAGAPCSDHYIQLIRDGRAFFGIEETRDLPCLPA